ncbi:hypothetical protein [Clostridium tagluense]|nr:hypothetical protein [Clostridium tagluense]MCB2299332.1 hypothetical protein [Clostridium tagluense]
MPDAMKVACPVLRQGKGGDNFQPLSMPIVEILLELHTIGKIAKDYL